MEDLIQGIILAIVAFLLGLVGDAIKKTGINKKKKLTYSRIKIPIVTPDKELPNSVRTRISEKELFNLVQFHVITENTGRTPVSNVNLLIKPNEGTHIIDYTVLTDPPELVKYSKVDTGESDKIRIDNINLRTKQSIIFDVYLESKEDPTLNVYWSNDEDVVILEGSVEGLYSVEESLIGIIRNYIFAIISPGLIGGILYFFASSFRLILRHTNTEYVTIGAVSIGEIIGNLLALYFYLKVIPYVLSLVRNFAKHKDYSNNLEENITGVTRNFVFAIISPDIVRGIFDFLSLPVYTDYVYIQFINSSGTLVGNLFGLYYYLRIIPYALNLVRDLARHKITKISSSFESKN